LWMLIVTPTRRGYMPPHGQADPTYILRCIRCVEQRILKSAGDT
jgi:hypothetical protein